MYSSFGTIDYNDTEFKPGWLIVLICTDLAKYYGRFRKMALPARGPHITFVAGEKEEVQFDFNILKQYHGRRVDFEYDNIVYTNGRAFWLEVKSKQLDDIREELGLKKMKWSLHATIGNIKNDIL